MGKTTLWHPIPLHVIRGAVEYCGFKFEKVDQLNVFPERGSARYNVTIVEWPGTWNELPIDVMQTMLQDCFMDDIRVHWLRRNRLDQWMAHLQISLGRDNAK